MPDLTCYACERDPVQQCPRCGRPYCEDHGEDFCNICLEPSSAVPSFTLYRGSLLALLVGAALAVWLIVQPPSEGSGSALRPIVITPTAPAAPGALTTVPAGTGTGSPQPAVTGTALPGATATSRPAASGTATAPGEYVVVSGDTLSGICSDKIRRPASMSVSDCVGQIKALNSLTSDSLEIGQKLKVPQ